MSTDVLLKPNRTVLEGRNAAEAKLRESIFDHRLDTSPQIDDTSNTSHHAMVSKVSRHVTSSLAIHHLNLNTTSYRI